METELKIKRTHEESFESLSEMAKDTGYLTCLNDVLHYIEAAKEPDGNISAEYLKLLLKGQITLLKVKHLTK